MFIELQFNYIFATVIISFISYWTLKLKKRNYMSYFAYLFCVNQLIKMIFNVSQLMAKLLSNYEIFDTKIFHWINTNKCDLILILDSEPV
jgi:hypothetical protein